MSSMFGRPQALSGGGVNSERLEAATVELEMVSDMFTRLVRSCHAKCIDGHYLEETLNKGEGVCADRCGAWPISWTFLKFEEEYMADAQYYHIQFPSGSRRMSLLASECKPKVPHSRPSKAKHQHNPKRRDGSHSLLCTATVRSEEPISDNWLLRTLD